MQEEQQPLNLRDIHAPRHPGMTDALCEAYAEAAEVCLARHHHPPRTSFSISCCENSSQVDLEWQGPSHEASRAWNNRDDATRDGAYIIALAVVEVELGLVGLARAETRTGADYYVGIGNADDLEEAQRLEVSGVDTGELSYLRRRLRDKLDQAARGKSNLPAYAAVVGFASATILIDSLDRRQ